ncbi:MAG TPA: hypothetical protein VG347_01520 [Verrucomicrobiae bacterium]|nr:hypothetical protein [Verrucomicrobiae bacterium]
MKKFFLLLAFLGAVSQVHAFTLFGNGGVAANADHANNIDNGGGTNVFVQGYFNSPDANTVDITGSAGGSYDGRYYLGPGVDATFQVGIQVHGSLAYFLGGYHGGLFKALVYGYSPAQGIWAGATNAWFLLNTSFSDLDGYSTETAMPLSNFQNVGGHFVGSALVTFSSPPCIPAGGHVYSLTKDDGRYLQHIQSSNIDGTTTSSGPKVILASAASNVLDAPFAVTIPANTLTHDGDSIDYIFEFAGNGVSDSRGIGFVFGGVFGSGRPLGGDTYFSEAGTLMRVDASHVMFVHQVSVVLNSGDTSGGDYGNLLDGTDRTGQILSCDWTAAQTFSVKDSVLDGTTALTFIRVTYVPAP